MISQKRIASEILKCGESRVWIAQDPKVGKAITRSDVRNLIKEGMIKKLPAKKAKRLDTRKNLLQKKKRRRKGPGSRKGTLAARIGKKETWLKIVRPQRKVLRELRKKKEIQEGSYRKLYKMVKGGVFRSKSHLLLYLQEKGLVKKAQ